MTDSNSFEPPFEPYSGKFDYNQLNELGNQAIALGFLLGHGYRGGQYELLRRGEAVLLSPQAACAYLKALIQSETQGDD